MSRMDFGSQLAIGTSSIGRPHLRYTGIWKGDIKSTGTDINDWEKLTVVMVSWMGTVKKGVNTPEYSYRDQ